MTTTTVTTGNSGQQGLPKRIWYWLKEHKDSLAITLAAVTILLNIYLNTDKLFSDWTASYLTVQEPSQFDKDAVCVGSDYKGVFYFNDTTSASQTNVQVDELSCTNLDTKEDIKISIQQGDGKSFLLPKQTNKEVGITWTPTKLGHYRINYRFVGSASSRGKQVTAPGSFDVTVVEPVTWTIEYPPNQGGDIAYGFKIHLEPHKDYPSGAYMKISLDEDHPAGVSIESVADSPDVTKFDYGQDGRENEIAKFHTVPLKRNVPAQLTIILRSKGNMSRGEWEDIAKAVKVTLMETPSPKTK